MARQAYCPDPVRTDQLGIEELFVVKGEGDNNHYFARLYDDHPEYCPLCEGQRFKAQNLFSRTYIDYLWDVNTPHAIMLVYEFHKYRCLNPDCRHIFTADISFASVNDRVTKRVENLVADKVFLGSSYEEICSEFQGLLSRQAIGQIFNRWTRSHNENRRVTGPPSIIGAITGHTDKEEYSLILSCDNGIRILDILLGVDSARIAASLRFFGADTVQYILTDCNPTVYAAAKEAFPSALHIVPAEMWLKLVREDFMEYAHEKMRWVQVRHKQSLMLDAPPDEEENIRPELKRIFDSRPGLQSAYGDYHYLRSAVANRQFLWTMNELDEWPSSIEDPGFYQQLQATLLQYREYRNEIAHHEEHRECVPENLLSSTDRLEELIRARRTFSEEALQAAVLYSTNSNPARWQGIRIEDIIQKLSQLQTDSKRREYDDE